MSNCLYLIIGRWKTPNHSKNRAVDDSHEIKKQILKAIGSRSYQRIVGNNPDIGINNAGIIILKGRGDRKPKSYESNIHAQEYFEPLFLKLNLYLLKQYRYLKKRTLEINPPQEFNELVILLYHGELSFEQLELLAQKLAELEISDVETVLTLS